LGVELCESAAAMQLGVTTPDAKTSNQQNEQAVLRGVGDAIAVIGAFHDAVLHAEYLPENQHARLLFNALELARCEALGANSYKGVGKNLARLQHVNYSAAKLKSFSGIEQLSLVLGCLANEALTGDPTELALGKLVAHWRPSVESRVFNKFAQLRTRQSDQSAYSEVALQLIQTLDVQSLVANNETDEQVAKPVASDDDDSDEQALQSDVADVPPMTQMSVAQLSLTKMRR